MNTYRRNTKILFTAVALIILAIFTVIGLANSSVKAEPNTVTNFYCEIAGQWSNHHFDISSARQLGHGEWRITYRDSGESTVYLQRRGEDCRILTLPKPEVK